MVNSLSRIPKTTFALLIDSDNQKQRHSDTTKAIRGTDKAPVKTPPVLTMLEPTELSLVPISLVLVSAIVGSLV
jgi:hypothetical protein